MSRWNRLREDPRRGRRFERGDLKYVILDLLVERAAHGYELMRELEERFHGFYTPSAGAVYPTLQWLQDLGYVTVAEQDERKVYTTTEAGREFLQASRERVNAIWERTRNWSGPLNRKEFRDETRELMRELREMTHSIRQELRWATPEKLRRAREVAARAGQEIRGILQEAKPEDSGPTPKGHKPDATEGQA